MEDLLKQILKMMPHHTDTLAFISGLAPTLEERIKSMIATVVLAEEDFGEEYMNEHRGHFWGLTETRPYMRARAGLADLLCEAGMLDEAIAECEEMIDLNPGDNQGMRDILLGLYLECNNLAGARDLMERYKETFFAVFNWGKVLERFLSGDLAGARKACEHARQKNRFVKDLLTGKQAMPDELIAGYSPGTREEAIFCMDMLGVAWDSHPEAIEWLRGQ